MTAMKTEEHRLRSHVEIGSNIACLLGHLRYFRLTGRLKGRKGRRRAWEERLGVDMLQKSC